MTREEAIEQLEDMKCYSEDRWEISKREMWKNEVEALKMAIKALEQAPILDKIEAEIQKLRGCSCWCSDGIIDDVEDIIDKYKVESEGEE